MTKEKQLEIAFNKIIKPYLQNIYVIDSMDIVRQLTREVKNRTKL